MPANIRLSTDKSTGHGCWPPTLPAMASTNVYVNGRREVRKGDAYVAHCCPSKGCHVGTAGANITKTYANGRLVHTVGAPITCGDTASGGSPNTFSG